MKKHLFNDDLLANPGDLENARLTFPKIFHVLDHPELRVCFAEFDDDANKARAQTRALGLTAICGTVIALIGSATEALWGSSGWAMWTSIALEVVAILAALLASGALKVESPRDKWLESRLMTERLRQWHFQLLVNRIHDIELSCDDSNPHAVEEFEAKRAEWFKIFCGRYKRGKLDSLLVDFSKPNSSEGDWMLEGPSTSISPGPLLDEIHDAYDTLRFKHQHGYANHVLRDSSSHWFFHFLRWPPLRQSLFLSRMIFSCVIVAFACSFTIIGWRVRSTLEGHAAAVGAAAHGPNTGSVCAILILTATILGVALRTIQEGLCVDEDIERYQEYRIEVDNLESTFDRTTDPASRHDLMIEMEDAVVKEMRQFLYSHKRAKFVL